MSRYKENKKWFISFFFGQINFTGLFMIFNRFVMRYLQKHVFIYSLLNKKPGNNNRDISMTGAILHMLETCVLLYGVFVVLPLWGVYSQPVILPGAGTGTEGHSWYRNGRPSLQQRSWLGHRSPPYHHHSPVETYTLNTGKYKYWKLLIYDKIWTLTYDIVNFYRHITNRVKGIKLLINNNVNYIEIFSRYKIKHIHGNTCKSKVHVSKWALMNKVELSDYLLKKNVQSFNCV